MHVIQTSNGEFEYEFMHNNTYSYNVYTENILVTNNIHPHSHICDYIWLPLLKGGYAFKQL